MGQILGIYIGFLSSFLVCILFNISFYLEVKKYVVCIYVLQHNILLDCNSVTTLEQLSLLSQI